MKSRKILSILLTFVMVISLFSAVSITASAASTMDYVITNNSAATFDVIKTSPSTVISTGAAFSVALAACTDAGTDGNLVIKLGDSESAPLELSEAISDADYVLKTATYTGYVAIQRDPVLLLNDYTYGLSIPSGENVILNNLIMEDTGNSDSTLSAVFLNGGTLTIDGTDTSLKVNGEYDTVLDIGSGNVTVNSGSLTSLGAASNTIKQSGGTLTINGGTLTGEGDDGTSAVIRVVSETDCSATISGSTIINSSGFAIYTEYNGGYGTVSIAGGTITGNKMGVYNLGNTVNISGGTITATTNFTIVNTMGTLNVSGGTIEAKGSFGTIGSTSTNLSFPAVTTISGNAKLKSDSGNIIYMVKVPIADTQTANIFGKTVSSDDNAVIMISRSDGYEMNKDTYGTFSVFAGDLEEAFTGWASDSARTNIISTVNPDTISNLTTGANSAVTNIYLKTGTASLAAPENLQVIQTNGIISVEDDNLYMTFDAAQSWLQNLKGIVVTKDGGNNIEGTDKWTVAANRIQYRADGNIPETATYDACGNFQLGNSDLFVKLALSGKDRICKTGSYTIKLMATGYDEVTMTFSITYGNFYGIKVIDQPSNITSGGNVGKVQVAAVDRFENVFTDIDGVHYSVATASAKDSAFTLGGTATAAFTNGIATFEGITATKTEGLTGAKLQFSVTKAGGGEGMIEENRPVLLAFAEPVSQADFVVSDLGNQNSLGQFLPKFFAAGGDSQTYTCDSEAFNISAPSPAGGKGSGTKTNLPESKHTDIVVDGQKQDSAATATTQTGSDGQTTKTVKLNDERIQDILEDLSQDGPVITVPAEGGGDRVVGMLNGQTVSTMEKYMARLIIKTDTATYTLPASEINIAEISKQFGGSVSLGDINVTVTISEPSSSTVKIVENAAEEGGFSIAVPAVEFEVNCTYNNKTIAVSSFHSYVERLIAIPSGVDPSKITTAIVVDPDGSVHHVPTVVTMIDGKYYAKINSLTNSVYSVIYNPIEFADVENHWAKDAINDMGSRMVVTGIGNNNYNPSSDITRAEFAAIIVRALGLDPGTGNNSFSDVASKNWYCEYTKTAASYGLILGYNDSSFRPNDKITREQAMAILTRAMEITNLDASVETSEISSLLSAYTDASKISGYAKNSAAICLTAGIVNGTSSTSIDPKDYVTRAEVAAMMQRLLQKSDLI